MKQRKTLNIDLADKALQSLTLGPDPLPSDGDEDNGADFDVLPESDHAEEDASLPVCPREGILIGQEGGECHGSCLCCRRGSGALSFAQG